jgi:hypothetical protein
LVLSGGYLCEMERLTRLRDGSSAAFMWEYFTTKKHYDSGRLRHIADIYTPFLPFVFLVNVRWPSWLITAHESLTENDKLDPRVSQFLEGVTVGIKYFYSHIDEGIEYIASNLGYTAQDARDWLKTVQHVEDASTVEPPMIEATVTILQKAGVVKNSPSISSFIVPTAQ